LDDIPPPAFVPGPACTDATSAATTTSQDTENIFQLLTTNDEPTAASAGAAAAKNLLCQIAAKTINDSVTKEYLQKADIRLLSTKKNLALLKKWIEEPHQRRPYFLLTKEKLIAICIAKFGGSTSFYTKERNEELIQRLATRHFHSSVAGGSFVSQAERRRRSNSSPTEDALHTSLLTKIIDASFMPRLTAKGKEYCKSGLKLELPFGRKLLQHSQEGISKFRVERLYCVGLVGRNDAPFAKASADFLGLAIIEGEETLFAVECKARVTPGTNQREREHAERLSRHHQRTYASNAAELYTIIEVTSGDFHKYVDSAHEAIQLMHTAFVYGFEYALLLIGDSSGNIIPGKYSFSEKMWMV
jgi:hypothetical protein